MLDQLKNMPAELVNSLWVFLGGSVVALLRSLVDGTRRNAFRLALGCLFGGIGAVVADRTFATTSWHIFWIGVAAVITENVVIGLFNASQKFKDDPINVFKAIWEIVVPSLGQLRGSDDKKD